MQFSRRVRAIDVAEEIGPGLAKATLAAELGGQIVGADRAGKRIDTLATAITAGGESLSGAGTGSPDLGKRLAAERDEVAGREMGGDGRRGDLFPGGVYDGRRCQGALLHGGGTRRGLPEARANPGAFYRTWPTGVGRGRRAPWPCTRNTPTSTTISPGHSILQQPSEADQHWRRFLDLAPDSPWAEQARSRLDWMASRHSASNVLRSSPRTYPGKVGGWARVAAGRGGRPRAWCTCSSDPPPLSTLCQRRPR